MPLREHVKDSMGGYMVWDIQEPADFFSSAIALNDYEISRLQAIKFPLRATQFLCARYLLRLLLPHVPQTQFTALDDVPIVAGSPEYTSISHSDNIVAVMVSANHPCGIDVQHTDDKILRIKDKYSSLKERKLFTANVSEITICSLLWTAKEAVYKCMHTKGLDFKTDMVLQKVHATYMEILYTPAQQVVDVHYTVHADYALAWCVV